MHFLKLCKDYASKDISTFLVFISLVDHTVHIHTKTCMTITFKQHFLPKIALLGISSHNYAKVSQVFQNVAKLKYYSICSVYFRVFGFN